MRTKFPKALTLLLLGSEPVWCALGSNVTSTSTSSITTSTPGHIDAPPAPTTIAGGNLTFSNAIVGYTTLGGPLSAGPTTGVIWSANSSNTDLPQAQRCWSSIVNWRPGSVAWYNAQIANSTWPLTVATSTSVILWETSTTIYPANASTYTLCDHTPRVDVEPITQHSSWNTTLSFTTTRLATPTYSVPKPCRPNNHICRVLYYESNIYNVSGTEDEWEHECGFPAHADPVEKPCLIAGGPVQLVYFPIETRGGNLCAHNGTTIAPTTMTAGDPPTITAMGTTFTSGSVYLSFSTLFAYYDGFGYNDTVGPTFTDHIVALPSSAISTHCGGWFSAMGPGTSMNYADLNWPVAASAYSCQGRCVIPAQTTSCDLGGCYVTGLPKDPHCDTIWRDINPVLALPTEVSKMVPEWSACSAFDEALPNFWFDPPLALQPTDAVATPSLPADETMSTPASPSSTAVRPAPQTTFPPPVPVALPTAQSEVLPSSGPQAPDNGEPDTSTSPQTWAYTTPPPVAGLTSTAGGSVAQVPGPGESDPGRLPSASASEVSSGNRLSSSSNNGDSDPSVAAQVSQTSSWNIADVLASILHLSKTLQSLQSDANTANVILATLTETRSTLSYSTVEAGSSIDPVHTTIITVSAPSPAGSKQTHTTTLPVSGGDASVAVVVDGTSVAVVGAAGDDASYTTSQASTVAGDTAETSSSSPEPPSGTGSGITGSVASPPTSISTDPPASTSDAATQTSGAYRSRRSDRGSVMIICAALMYLVAASLE